MQWCQKHTSQSTRTGFGVNIQRSVDAFLVVGECLEALQKVVNRKCEKISKHIHA